MKKTVHKENLKEMILQAAKKFFVENGVEQTTIRKIANEIGYSVGTVYVYYKNKNDILHDLHTQGFKQLNSNMKLLSNVENPMERLKALGVVYVQFAIENPDMYNLMFNLKAPIDFLETLQNEKWNEGKTAFELLRNAIELCMKDGYFVGHKLEPLSFTFWSLVHGISSLSISQRIKGINLENPNTILIDSLKEFVLMIDRK